MNAEIVARLQQSFDGGTDAAELRSQLETQRFVAEQFDATRVLLASMYMTLVNSLPKDAKVPLPARAALVLLTEWLSKPTAPNAIQSFVDLVDGATPEVLDALRYWAAHADKIDIAELQHLRNEIAHGAPLRPKSVSSEQRSTGIVASAAHASDSEPSTGEGIVASAARAAVESTAPRRKEGIVESVVGRPPAPAKPLTRAERYPGPKKKGGR